LSWWLLAAWVKPWRGTRLLLTLGGEDGSAVDGFPLLAAKNAREMGYAARSRFLTDAAHRFGMTSVLVRNAFAESDNDFLGRVGVGKTRVGKGEKSAKKQTKKLTKRATKTKEAKAKTSRARSGKSKKKVDMVQVREGISNMVGEAAPDIVEGLITVAKTGSLNQVKYAFEVAGLYPATEATAEEKESEEDQSLAKVLLDRLGDVVTPKSEVGEKDEEDEEESVTGAEYPAVEEGKDRTSGAKAPFQGVSESQR
jgi:soluble cytochrome b562